jgi:hypothetical protein
MVGSLWSDDEIKFTYVVEFVQWHRTFEDFGLLGHELTLWSLETTNKEGERLRISIAEFASDSSCSPPP